MKRNLVSAALAGGLFAVLATATAYAQMPGARANIPFDFSVRGKTLPAGTYEIKRAMNGPDALLISNVNDNHDRIIFVTNQVDAKAIPIKSELVFNRYGDNYFLSEVFDAGEQSGREAIPSRQEGAVKREFANNLASNNATAGTETVAVVTY